MNPIFWIEDNEPYPELNGGQNSRRLEVLSISSVTYVRFVIFVKSVMFTKFGIFVRTLLKSSDYYWPAARDP